VYTLDTNAIIYYVKDDPRAVPILRDILRSSVSLYISTITETELFGYPSLTEEEAVRIENILKGVSPLSVDSHIARAAGHIRATYRLKLADSIIAATALFTSSTLLTRNTKDFSRVPTLSIQPV
jgi:predicted nucleic acid-binding protein